MGTSQKDILVTPVNTEFQDTRQDKRMLIQLAAQTSGTYFSEDASEDIFAHLDLQNKSEITANSFDLWQKLPALLLILALFSIEWFVRKRKGLP